MKHFVLLFIILFFVVSCSRITPIEGPTNDLETLVIGTYFLSDLRWETAKNGLGPFEKDSSNGGKDGGDGLPLTINTVTYAKGLGLQAPSEMVYNLGGNCSSFSAKVGIDDQWNTTGGSVVFQVFADSIKIWDSGLITDQTPIKSTGSLSSVGKQTLRLVVTEGGNGTLNDYADWVNPVITCDPAPPALAASNAQLKGSYGTLEAWPTVAYPCRAYA